MKAKLTIEGVREERRQSASWPAYIASLASCRWAASGAINGHQPDLGSQQPWRETGELA